MAKSKKKKSKAAIIDLTPDQIDKIQNEIEKAYHDGDGTLEIDTVQIEQDDIGAIKIHIIGDFTDQYFTTVDIG